MAFVTEPAKQVKVVCEADVVVAGAGVAGTFAAIAAARHGARTVLVDRFGSVGGNIGPGMINNGHMVSGKAHDLVSYECTVYPRLYGIGREFLNRYAELGGKSIPPYTGRNYPGDASIASYVAQRMLEESGVRLLLSTQVADPIMDGNRVTGLFVENKSGRGAIPASVVIDGTGEADVARRAGAPFLLPKDEYAEVDGHSPTGMGLYFLMGGVDWERYHDYVSNTVPPEEDVRWGIDVFGEKIARGSGATISALRRAYEKGEYSPLAGVTLDGTSVGLSLAGPMEIGMAGVAAGRVSPARTEVLDAGSGEHISLLEAGTRAAAFELCNFWKTNVPGFENVSLLCTAPYLGSRGGPSIEGDYVLTMDDCREGKRFDDVMYLYGEFRALRYACEHGGPKWVDVPYRALLPKGIEGLMAVGRAASGKPDTLLRNRMACKVMGEAAGIAAAMAFRKGVAPRAVEIRELQGALLDAGFYLGDRYRLKELGLV